MKKIATIILLLILTTSAIAQQDALYNQYVFNQFAVNPAYAGSRRTLSAALLARQQWTGFDGSPSTQSFSIHGPIGKRKMALGLNIINDEIGPTNTTGILGTYAYHLPFAKGKLSMALRVGLYENHINIDKLDYQTPQYNNYNEQLNNSKPTTNFDFGLYYYTTKFYAGIASLHLFPDENSSTDSTAGTLYKVKTHLIATAGKSFVLNPNIVFKPSIMIKNVEAAPGNIDLTTSFLFNKKFLLGLSFRTSKTLALITSFYITDYFKIGYSYDIAFSKLNHYNNGSHEIFIGYDFSFSKTKPFSYN